MSTSLPRWRSVLAVAAHPDDESFALGALLSTFVNQGATVSVLCFTRGEASTLHGVDGDLPQVRALELRAAADELGIGHVDLKNHPDGALSGVDLKTLVDGVTTSISAVDADGIIVFDIDGVTGHPTTDAPPRRHWRPPAPTGSLLSAGPSPPPWRHHSTTSWVRRSAATIPKPSRWSWPSTGPGSREPWRAIRARPCRAASWAPPGADR